MRRAAERLKDWADDLMGNKEFHDPLLYRDAAHYETTLCAAFPALNLATYQGNLYRYWTNALAAKNTLDELETHVMH